MNAAARISLIFALLLLAIAGGWLLSKSLQPSNTDLQHALRLPEPMPLPEFTLQDQDGQALQPATLRGQWTLVFFGFTHCPDICPATLQLLSLARQKLAAEHELAALPEILLISVDPDRDTPEVLREYTQHFGDGVSGGTGSPAELAKLAESLGVYFAKEEGARENYSVAHSAHVVVLNDNADYSAVFSAPHSIDAFVQDLPLLMTSR